MAIKGILWVVLFVLTGNYSFSQDSSIIKSRPPESPRYIVVKYGFASFYATKFNGRKTSNGDTYNSEVLTAACNVLPLGTWVKVTNVRNDRSVVVKINDHLHPRNKRLIDLSKTAARELDFVAYGITKVKVEVLGTLKPRQLKAINTNSGHRIRKKRRKRKISN